jgi:sulfite exporter TauE/SafE
VLVMMGAILVASLLGSLHCAGMCGAFLAISVAPAGEGSGVPAWRLHAAYHAGRLGTYVTLGVLAGALGSALNLAGDLAGVQRVAGFVAGLVMLTFGLACVGRAMGVRLPRMPVPRVMERVVVRGHGWAERLGASPRAVVIGLLTTLLPCGWLYAFVATAAGTAHPGLGALAMATFWVGTLPVMAALGLGVQRGLGPLRRFMPLATSLLLVGAGLATLAGRVSVMQPGEGTREVVCHPVR